MDELKKELRLKMIKSSSAYLGLTEECFNEDFCSLVNGLDAVADEYQHDRSDVSAIVKAVTFYLENSTDEDKVKVKESLMRFVDNSAIMAENLVSLRIISRSFSEILKDK